MSSNLSLSQNPTLKDLQEYVRLAVQERGFKDDETVIAQRFMLLLEESGEFARAARKAAGIPFAPDTNTADLANEAADVLVILLGICNLLNIDLENALRQKEEHNKTRTWE